MILNNFFINDVFEYYIYNVRFLFSDNNKIKIIKFILNSNIFI